MDFDTRQIRRFLVVAEEGSFTRAAKRLHVSQSSLTRAIAAIELESGLKLLERTTRKVELTEEGKKIKEDLQHWLRDLDKILSPGSTPRSMKLGFSWVLPDTWTEYAVRNFEAGTRARVEFVRDDTRYAGADSGDADVAVVRGSWRTTDLHSVLLFHEHRVLAVRKDSALARRPRVRWTEIADYPLVVNEVNGTTRPGDWPSDGRPDVSERCRNFDEWIESVAAGHGVGVTALSVPRRVSHPLVRFLQLDAAPKIPVYLVYPHQGTHPLAERFVRAALQAVDQMVEESAAHPVDERAGRRSGH